MTQCQIVLEVTALMLMQILSLLYVDESKGRCLL